MSASAKRHIPQMRVDIRPLGSHDFGRSWRLQGRDVWRTRRGTGAAVVAERQHHMVVIGTLGCYHGPCRRRVLVILALFSGNPLLHAPAEPRVIDSLPPTIGQVPCQQVKQYVAAMRARHELPRTTTASPGLVVTAGGTLSVDRRIFGCLPAVMLLACFAGGAAVRAPWRDGGLVSCRLVSCHRLATVSSLQHVPSCGLSKI